MPFEIRPIRPEVPQEMELVAKRMGITLVEVLGEKTGREMYTSQWLLERVKWHLDPMCCHGAIFVATKQDLLVGHTIVRVDADESNEPLGLFSTTYVIPEARRDGVANALLQRGEAWLRAQGMTTLATNTSTENTTKNTDTKSFSKCRKTRCCDWPRPSAPRISITRIKSELSIREAM